MGYMFPKMRTVDDNTVEYAVCKLAEETGEVAECICKGYDAYIVDEVMDVMQCCENLLRKMEVTDEQYDQLVFEHVEYEYGRGYYVE